MIYLDSALLEEAEKAREFGWVKGITTNPNLLAKSTLSPEETLKQLSVISPGQLYYQLVSSSLDQMLAEGHQAYEIIGEKTVLKIPATSLGFKVVSILAHEITCSVTAIYSSYQAAIAAEAGAKYAIAYVNRATRLLGDGLGLVKEMAEVLKGSSTEILAASLKSPQEAAAALQCGRKAPYIASKYSRANDGTSTITRNCHRVQPKRSRFAYPRDIRPRMEIVTRMSENNKFGLGDLVQKAIYLGVGMANFAAQRAGTALQELRQQAQKLADEMVKRGEMNVDDAKKFVDDIMKNAQQQTVTTDNSTVKSEPRQIEIITDDEDEEVEKLKKRVQSLQDELRNLNKQ